MFEYNGYKFEPLRKRKVRILRHSAGILPATENLACAIMMWTGKSQNTAGKDSTMRQAIARWIYSDVLKMVSYMSRVSMSCLHLHKLASQN